MHRKYNQHHDYATNYNKRNGLRVYRKKRKKEKNGDFLSISYSKLIIYVSDKPTIVMIKITTQNKWSWFVLCAMKVCTPVVGSGQ